MSSNCKFTILLIVILSFLLNFPFKISENTEVVVLVFKETPLTVEVLNSRTMNLDISAVDLFFDGVGLSCKSKLQNGYCHKDGLKNLGGSHFDKLYFINYYN
jgi:hypothetical protein